MLRADMTELKIAPSILAADFASLGAAVDSVAAVADMLHIDVMDGHFVPNLSIGMPVIASLRAVTDLPFDCHLMTTNAIDYLSDLAAAGATHVTVHAEVYQDPAPVIARANAVGLTVGIAVNPITPVAAITPFVDDVAMLLVMSVEPGFGGQSFIDAVLPKVETLRKLVDSHGLQTDIEIDGGISPANTRRVWEAGANVLVAGSAIFAAEDPVAAVAMMRAAIT
jgi:ribulose-phosphate 3-epimerase